MQVLRFVFMFGPLVFGVAFLGPLIAQSLTALGWTAPFAMAPLGFGIVVGALLGALATWRGRWV